MTEETGAAMAVILLRRGSARAASQALTEHFGLALPKPGRASLRDGISVLWSGPDRFLVLQEDPRTARAEALDTALRDLAHVVEASSSRTIFSLAGDSAAEALSRLLPIDLHPRAFPPGSVALTLANHTDVQVWRTESAFRMACATSFAGSLRATLKTHFSASGADR